MLTLLGRAGRWEVIQTLRQGGTWTVRDLARATGVNPMTSARTVQELANLEAVELARPGRDAKVTFRADTAVGAFLAALQVPSFREETLAIVEQWIGAAGIHEARLGTTQAGDPLAPTKVILVTADDEATWDEAPAILDAIRLAGLPPPDLETIPAGT